MNDIKIRRATLEDMEMLRIFEQGVIKAERPFDTEIKDDPVLYYNMEELITADHIELLVAEVDGRLVGTGYARTEPSLPFYKNPFYAYLGFMYVLPEYRGKGVNSLIIDGLKAWAVSRNLTELRLQVYEGNTPAISAYEKVGFKKLLIEMRLDATEKKS